ncbi:MAG: NUDIX hydrolase [Candidatus Omnitrophota bacterium]
MFRYLDYIANQLKTPFVTVDAIIEIGEGIVIIERKNPPFGWALPGGFVDYGESLEDAVRREAKEETGLSIHGLVQLHTYSNPSRDPRFHTIGTVFIAKACGMPRAGDDAAGLKVVPLTELKKLQFAFDHKKIIEDYLQFKEGKPPFQPLA